LYVWQNEILGLLVDVIIPAYNEEKAIGEVLREIPFGLVRHVVVANNGSTDRTAAVAEAHGAIVVHEPRKGYGQACLTAMEKLKDFDPAPDIVVFIDGDYSDYPEEMPQLLQPIKEGKADMVIGSRSLGNREKGSMTIPQLFGNWLATSLMHLLFGARYTDLGPFRAIRYDKLLALEMRDRNFGWTVEMQIKAAKQGLKYCEVPVNYRQRIGVSKVSGTVKGTFMAGYKILFTIMKYAWR
jgi:glycosyltransferase involved in cell wall biosynthesis